jgi:glycerol-3-phosphate dehydrogenase (NAD(P)+)
MRQISVIGCGRWGGFLAWHFAALSERVYLYGRPGSGSFVSLRENRRNGYLVLRDNIIMTSSLDDVFSSEKVFVSVGCQGFRSMCGEVASFTRGRHQMILAMKGLENSTGLRMSDIARELLATENIAILVGPGHPQSLVEGVPTLMLIDSRDPSLTDRLVNELNTTLIRLYKGSDVVGNEIGAALKNVIGIAAGLLDGAGYSSLKGPLMARGAAEVARLMEAEGGDPKSAFGLSHLGDYEATLFSQYSRNRAYGESFIKKLPFDGLAEGVETLRAVKECSRKHRLEMPICDALYRVIFEELDPMEVLNELFKRSVKEENAPASRYAL